MNGRNNARLILLVLASAWPVGPSADLVLEVSVDRISAEDWTVDGASARFVASVRDLGVSIRLARIRFANIEHSLDSVSVDCGSVQVDALEVSCARAQFGAEVPAFGVLSANGTFRYDRRTGLTEATLADVAAAGGRIRFDVTTDETRTGVRFSSDALALDALVALAAQFGYDVDSYTATGKTRLSGRLETRDGNLSTFELEATVDADSLGNEAGTVAAENLATTISLSARARDGGYEFDLSLDSDRGEFYFEPVYANLSEHALRVQAQGVRTRDFVEFDLPRVQLEHGTLVDAVGAVTLSVAADDESPLKMTGSVELNDASVSTLYTNLIQIPMAGTLFGNLETAGRVRGTVTLDDNAPTAARLELDDLILDDRRGRFAIYGLSGSVDWPAAGVTGSRSALRWDSAMAYSIVVGGAEASFRLSHSGAELLAPLEIPTMGGALRIDRLALDDYGSDDASGVLDARLEPIQLGQLTGAFGWPAFSGTLSGELPLLRLEANAITVGGTLSARAFDGAIELSDLRIDQPFGRVPRLTGDLRLRDLDLQRITETFSFGLIQGRLSGDVTGLTMVNWRPVAMDMHLYTPPDDPTPHRITQRAIENLASVGGGGAGVALSSGFLQFFEVFAYDRIGLTCRLRNSVCAMGGTGQARDDGGYYIVKGRGLPRIDVVGYRDEVSWPTLIRQLAAISASDSPTVN